MFRDSWKKKMILSKRLSNTKTLHEFQFICIRLETSSPWCFIRNLHGLKILTLNQLAKLYCFKFHTKLNSHSNPLIKQLFFISFLGNVRRKLKRQWPTKIKI